MEVDPLPDIDSEDLDILPISEQEWKDLMEEFECPDIQIELIEPEGISKFFGNFDPENSDTEQILPSLNPDEGSTVTSKVSEVSRSIQIYDNYRFFKNDSLILEKQRHPGRRTYFTGWPYKKSHKAIKEKG